MGTNFYCYEKDTIYINDYRNGNNEFRLYGVYEY